MKVLPNLHVSPSEWHVQYLSPTHTESLWDPVSSETKSKLVGTDLRLCIPFFSDHHASQTGVIPTVLYSELMLMRKASSVEEWREEKIIPLVSVLGSFKAYMVGTITAHRRNYNKKIQKSNSDSIAQYVSEVYVGNYNFYYGYRGHQERHCH